MNQISIIFVCAMSVTFWSGSATADYLRTGPMIKKDCKGIGVEWCNSHELVAVVRDGQMYEIATRIPDKGVDEYSARKGMCYKTLRSEGAGLLSHAINAVFLQTYVYRNEQGKQQEVEPDKLRFSCRKI